MKPAAGDRIARLMCLETAGSVKDQPRTGPHWGTLREWQSATLQISHRSCTYFMACDVKDSYEFSRGSALSCHSHSSRHWVPSHRLAWLRAKMCATPPASSLLLTKFLSGFPPCTFLFLLDMVLPHASRRMQQLQSWESVCLAHHLKDNEVEMTIPLI